MVSALALKVRRQATAQEIPTSFLHFRDKDSAEVDIVLEQGARAVAAIEVKASSTVTASDFRGIRKLKTAAGARFVAGVVLYDGETVVAFADDLFAVPICALLEPGGRAR